MNDTSPRPVPASVNGWNAEYLDAEYTRYRADPASVPADMAAFFHGFDLGLDGAFPAGGAASGSSFDERVVDLINAYREQGHLAARLDPFDRDRPRPATLALAPHGLADADLSRPVNGAQVGLPEGVTLRDLVAHLEKTYCRSIGLEFMHIRSDAERAWFLANYEKFGGMRTPTRQEQLRVLDQLTRGECYEAFAQKRYGSEKRFSLEGGISLIPMLDQLIERAGGLGVEEIVVGMSHRGRVNVLINIMGKSYEQVFTEFEDNWEAGFADGGGDVKYHRGYSGTRALSTGQTMHLAMASNPSHLEAANGVVLGRCRAKQRVRGDAERRRVVPLLLHGDAAVAGQGVVAECLNMSQLEGYTVGGTVHVVINNLIGFTTLPEDARSSTYCTDVAKMVDAPIFHVNGEDPEACVAVARLAIEYRQEFKKDVFVDMFCYRKYGHNEGDEPSFTQPILAALIKAKTATLQTYAERLLAEKVITSDDAKAIWDRLDAALDAAQTKAKKAPNVPLIDPGSARWAGMNGEFSFEPVNTGVSKETLEEVCAALGRAPEDFAVNPKLAGLLKARAELVQTGHVSHSEGELLAIGTLLLEGLPVRLSGQDARRGTFTQRHAVIRDFTNGTPYVGLNNMREMGDPTHPPPQNQADGRSKQARFCVYDSPLSEYAIMAFEYGYSLADPNMLVMWEAQFGDFANTAQVIPDQFLSAGEIKWSRWSGLVLLLPHGYEGAGPEHSSAKLERFLQLCADDNMQVCYPSTGAQTFHMLRRQVKRGFRKPLIVMTPKSMLRVATSTIDELMTGSFKDIFDDPAFDIKGGLDRKGVKRVVFCSGKVYHELAERVKVLAKKDTALVRIEQLYPFNTELAKATIAKYPKIAEMVWAQEEPRNAGAYLYVSDQFRTQFGIELKYIGREPSATPAVGSKRADKLQQESVIAAAIGPKPKEAAKDTGGKKDAPAKAGVK